MSTPESILLRHATVLIHDPKSKAPKLEVADIGIKEGKIAEINPSSSFYEKHMDLTGLHILPGWIDSQVHFRDPGMEHKEDLQSGTEAAAAGGITAVFEMPNTKPATIDRASFEEKLKRAKEKCCVDYAFYVGATGSNNDEIKDIEKSEGCCGVKIFMGSSTGDLLVDKDEKLESILRSLSRRPAIHSEDEHRLKERKALAEAHPGQVEMHPVWRDEVTALKATERILSLAKKTQRPVHVLHVTTAEEMDFLSKNKDFASVEVTPQHLTLFAPDCYKELGTKAQMNPPIRDKKHQEALWKALRAGVVDVLGSDHAPHTLKEKDGTYPATPSGMPGVQTLVPIMLNHVHAGRLDLFHLNRLLAVNPCKLWGIQQRGFIHPGYEATFTIVDLKRVQSIEASWLKYRCGWSPFEGMKVTGWPIHTMIRGQFALREEVLQNFRGQALKMSQ